MPRGSWASRQSVPHDGRRQAAVGQPAGAEGADIRPEALERIVSVTKGYPEFFQEWGKHAWNAAGVSPIAVDDVRAAAERATEALDRSFFRVRYDRLTPREQDCLRAMAELGPGPHRSGAGRWCIRDDRGGHGTAT